MDMNVRALSDQAFHKVHGLPFADLPGIPESIPATGEGTMLRMRMDACLEAGEPRIFAVFPAEDVAHLPVAGRISSEGSLGLPGSSLFFMQGPDGLAIYVDTDANERLWVEILDDAYDAGLEVLSADCDLDMIRRLHMPGQPGSADVDPPALAAFEARGFAHVPIEVGVDLLRRAVAPEAKPNDPGVPGL